MLIVSGVHAALNQPFVADAPPSSPSPAGLPMPLPTPKSAPEETKHNLQPLAPNTSLNIRSPQVAATTDKVVKADLLQMKTEEKKAAPVGVKVTLGEWILRGQEADFYNNYHEMVAKKGISLPDWESSLHALELGLPYVIFAYEGGLFFRIPGPNAMIKFNNRRGWGSQINAAKALYAANKLKLIEKLKITDPFDDCYCWQDVEFHPSTMRKDFVEVNFDDQGQFYSFPFDRFDDIAFFGAFLKRVQKEKIDKPIDEETARQAIEMDLPHAIWCEGPDFFFMTKSQRRFKLDTKSPMSMEQQINLAHNIWRSNKKKVEAILKGQGIVVVDHEAEARTCISWPLQELVVYPNASKKNAVDVLRKDDIMVYTVSLDASDETILQTILGLKQ